jgi:hypothetical protein
MDFIDAYLEETLASMTAFRTELQHRQVLIDMSDVIVNTLRRERKLLVCGNGGSAGDAQHIAGESISRLMYDRAPLAAIALTTDSSVVTAIGNGSTPLIALVPRELCCPTPAPLRRGDASASVRRGDAGRSSGRRCGVDEAWLASSPRNSREQEP